MMEYLTLFLLSITIVILALMVFVFVRKWFSAMSIISKQKGEIRSLEQELHNMEKINIAAVANQKEISVSYFTETSKNLGMFSDSYIVTYKMQLIVDKLPIGSSSIVKIDSYKKVDKEQVNKTLTDFAKPLVELGVKVAMSQITA